ncbi:ABC transporter permease [Hallella multisaccharivorax]|uniref:ABC transporter permease n=1 Tax=Hallella multisaccharivorax TaxID=310514 RepID=UPI00360ED33F
MILKYLLRKEFTQIRRNSFLPRLIVVYPIIITCVMPWVMNMEVKNIKVDVVDNDRSVESQRLVHHIEHSPYFHFGGQKASYDEALKDIECSDADVVTVIPPHYAKNLVLGQKASVLIAANAVNGQKGGLGSSYLSNIVAANLSDASNSESVINAFKASSRQVSELYLYNKRLDYKLFMVPTLIGMVMMMLCGFLPALNIVGEKEAGTIEQINVTPVSKMDFILAKLIPYWVIGLLVMTVCLFVAWVMYGFMSAGSVGWVYLLAVLLAFIFSGIGLIVSNYNDTMQQAIFIMWFIVVCFNLLSGLFTPVRSMPDWAQNITIINPMRCFTDAIRTVYVRGGDFSSIRQQVLILSVFAIGMDTWAVLSYKKNGK